MSHLSIISELSGLSVERINGMLDAIVVSEEHIRERDRIIKNLKLKNQKTKDEIKELQDTVEEMFTEEDVVKYIESMPKNESPSQPSNQESLMSKMGGKALTAAMMIAVPSTIQLIMRNFSPSQPHPVDMSTQQSPLPGTWVPVRPMNSS